MNKIIDLHHHLDTLPYLFNLRNRLQSHKISLNDYLKDDQKVIISTAFYVSLFSDFQGLIEMITSIKSEALKLGNKVKIITSRDQLDDDYNLGLIFHVESARCLKDPINQMQQLFDHGVRGIIPMHFKDNHLGTSCDDIFRRIGFKKQDHGLTDLGEKFVQKCNELGIWLDVTHTTDQTADDILDSAKEVMVSHIGVREIKDLKRNKSIQFYKKLAKKQGVIGMIPWTHLIGEQKDQYKLQLKTLLSENLTSNIAIGTDLGAPIKTHSTIKSSFDLKQQIDGLPHAEDILWGNAYRFFKRALPN